MTTEHEIANRRAAIVGEIILQSRQIESQLHKICATDVTGLHALTELTGSKLPEDIKRQLHYIATIRNRAAHESEFDLSENDFLHYQQTVSNVGNALIKLFPEASGNSGSIKTFDDEKELDMAVEKELFAQWRQKISRLGYIPGIGVVFLLFLLVHALFMQYYLLLLALIFACASILSWRGWHDPMDRGLLYIGAGALGMVHICLMILCFAAPVKGVPKLLGLFPILNIFYLLVRYLRNLKWGEFLTALAGLALFAGAIAAFCQSALQYGLLLLGGSWIVSLAAASIWGKKREK